MIDRLRAPLGVFLVAFAAPLHGQASVRYDTAFVDSTGLLHIVTHDHRRIVPASDSDQVGFDAPRVSPDHASVGWLALFPNCCTSYPIPLELVVLHRGARRVISGNGLPIWRWRFDSGGRRVAYYQETVHGGAGRHYELRDVRTGHTIATYDPTDSTRAPPWAAVLQRP